MEAVESSDSKATQSSGRAAQKVQEFFLSGAFVLIQLNG